MTPVDAGVARPLIEGLSTETIVTDDSARRLFDIDPRRLRSRYAKRWQRTTTTERPNCGVWRLSARHWAARAGGPGALLAPGPRNDPRSLAHSERYSASVGARECSSDPRLRSEAGGDQDLVDDVDQAV